MVHWLTYKNAMGQLAVTGLWAKINLIQVAENLPITIFLQDLLRGFDSLLILFVRL